MSARGGTIAIPIFCYDHFATKSAPPASVNLGDAIQTVAIRALLLELGVPQQDIRFVNRDALPAARGTPVRFIMHGVYASHCFPLPEEVTPIFIGFCTDERTIFRHRATLKKWEPIGCRDAHVTALMRLHGIRAYTSGCLTMSLPPRDAKMPLGGKPFIIGGEGEGMFPARSLDTMPAQMKNHAEFIFQREPVAGYPLSTEQALGHVDLASRLLDRYRTEASLVVTSLLHAATPCAAMGVPTIVVRQQPSSRFSALSAILPVHSLRDVGAIDWAPPAADFSRVRALQKNLLASVLAGGLCQRTCASLDEIFGVVRPQGSLVTRVARIWSRCQSNSLMSRSVS